MSTAHSADDAHAAGAPPRFAAVVVAAGRGSRMGPGLPKQYRSLGRGTVLEATVRVFLAHPACESVLVAIHPDDEPLYRDGVRAIDDERLLAPVPGGATRQASVRAGLAALAARGAPPAVLVHDAARPFATAKLVDAVLAALCEADGAIPGLAVSDTLKRVGEGGRIAATVARDGLIRAQTPQGFRFEAIRAAHEAAAAAGEEALTDDAAVAERAGLAVAVVPGDPRNVKITTEEDLVAANAAARAPALPRTGFGYDVHALEPGERIVLGGLEIAHDRRLAGHSDADVALHALTDALLGALADGDIGSHFPPSDPTWKGASSDRFLAHAASLARERGGEIVHLDLTVVCERPKIGPLREAMRARIAGIVGVPVGRVSVKATTSERLGFAGREEGIAASAVATVLLPAAD